MIVALSGLLAIVPAAILQTDPLTPWRLGIPWQYDPALVPDYVKALPPHGPEVVIVSHLALDVPFLIAYAICLSSYSLRLWSTNGRRLVANVGLTLSVTAASADLLEDVGIVAMLSTSLADHPLVAVTTWAISWIKWVCLVSAVGIVAFGQARSWTGWGR